MKLRIATALIVCMAALAMPALAQSVSGPVRVVDGDTLAMQGQRIRIHGINAPESDQLCDQGRWACGQEATRAMERLVAGASVTCHGRDRDHYGRLVAVCFNRQGQDLGRTLVEMGMATAYRRYSTDYVGAESAARTAQRGIWSGQFQDPEAFNHQGALPASVASLPAVPGLGAGAGLPASAKGAVGAALGWVGKMAGAAVERSRHTSGSEYRLTAPDKYGYGDFHDYNNDGIVDGGPRRSAGRTSRSALTPPSQGAAPEGMQVQGPLTADQVCAVMALAGQPCR